MLAEFVFGFFFALAVFTAGLGFFNLIETVSDFIRWKDWLGALYPFIICFLFGLVACLTPIIDLEKSDDGDGVDELKVVVPVKKQKEKVSDE